MWFFNDAYPVRCRIDNTRNNNIVYLSGDDDIKEKRDPVEVNKKKKNDPPRVYFPPSTPLNPIPVGRGANAAAAVGRDARRR